MANHCRDSGESCSVRYYTEEGPVLGTSEGRQYLACGSIVGGGENSASFLYLVNSLGDQAVDPEHHEKAAELSHICFAGSDPPRRVRVRRSPRAPIMAVRGPRRNSTECGGEGADAFLLWLFQQFGLDATDYRSSALRRRLPACLRALRVCSVAEAKRLLEIRPEMLPVAVNAVLIGVSSFFRDPPVFKYLRSRVLPELLRNRDSLRVLSAGVATGQELYSVAMLLEERGALEGSYLLGVDCRGEAIAQARAGVFSDAGLAGMDAGWRERFFEQVKDQWVASNTLRKALHWKACDLFSGTVSEPWDVILFRNVGIYLERSRAESLWAGLAAQLSVGGIFVTGKAERPPSVLPLVRLAACVYRKTS